MDKKKARVGDTISVKTLKEIQQIPSVVKKRRGHLFWISEEDGVFITDLMSVLCGNSYTVEDINRRGRYVIHHEGQVFTLTDWMIDKKETGGVTDRPQNQ